MVQHSASERNCDEAVSLTDLTHIIAEQWRWIEMASNIKAHYEEKYQQNLIQYNSLSNVDAR
jgi:hypothetical protein